MADNTQVAASERHVQTISSSSQSQDVITFVNPDQSSQAPYMIYAPTAASFKRSDGQQRTSDGVSLQHTPVIQTSAIQQEHVRNLVEDGTIIVRQNEMKK